MTEQLADAFLDKAIEDELVALVKEIQTKAEGTHALAIAGQRFHSTVLIGGKGAWTPKIICRSGEHWDRARQYADAYNAAPVAQLAE